jgi:hypothetical protein
MITLRDLAKNLNRSPMSVDAARNRLGIKWSLDDKGHRYIDMDGEKALTIWSANAERRYHTPRKKYTKKPLLEVAPLEIPVPSFPYKKQHDNCIYKSLFDTLLAKYNEEHKH